MKTYFVIEYSYSIQHDIDYYENYSGYEEVYAYEAEDAIHEVEQQIGQCLNLKTVAYSNKNAEKIKLKYDLPQIKKLLETGSIQNQEQQQILKKWIAHSEKIINS
ncbi:hypothetical protein [Paenibacillus sp. NPDC057934]|uniref:hypothetical protein n=1 Tax=Paenibacillus sp. NPDC057934 TaxID=3346282 RepID=UPI0036D81DE9